MGEVQFKQAKGDRRYLTRNQIVYKTPRYLNGAVYH